MENLFVGKEVFKKENYYSDDIKNIVNYKYIIVKISLEEKNIINYYVVKKENLKRYIDYFEEHDDCGYNYFGKYDFESFNKYFVDNEKEWKEDYSKELKNYLEKRKLEVEELEKNVNNLINNL